MWKLADELDWFEGTPGKGILLDNDEVMTWTTGEDGTPIHMDYCAMHDVPQDSIRTYFEIAPDGGVTASLSGTLDPDSAQIIEHADHNLHAHLDPAWHFGSDDHDKLDWEEGNEGKGILDRSGHVYTWNDDDYEIHADFLAHHPEIMPMVYFTIESNGRVDGAGMGNVLDEAFRDTLREADPRLHVNDSAGPSWQFG